MTIKQIALIGGAGMTELGIAETAALQGIKVRTLSLKPSSIHQKLRKHVEVILGDPLTKGDVDHLIKGCDAVIVTLGTLNEPVRYLLSPTKMMPAILKNIFWAMERNNIKLISVCLSCFLIGSRRRPPMPLEFQDIHLGHERLAQMLVTSGSFNWIGVFPPYTTRTPADFKVESASSDGSALTKYDVGRFLVVCLSKKELYKNFSSLGSFAKKSSSILNA